MPGSPRSTSARLRPARTSASSPSRVSHCCLRPHNITRRPFGGSSRHRRTGSPPSTPPGPGPHAGVPTRDPTDANELVPGGGCWHGQSAWTFGDGDHLPTEEHAAVDSTGRPAQAARKARPARPDQRVRTLPGQDPLTIDDDQWRDLHHALRLSAFNLHTQSRDAGHGHPQTGFTGTATLRLDKNTPTAIRQAFGTLTRFAEFSGTGAQTTHGFGATSILTTRDQPPKDVH